MSGHSEGHHTQEKPLVQCVEDSPWCSVIQCMVGESAVASPGEWFDV